MLIHFGQQHTLKTKLKKLVNQQKQACKIIFHERNETHA